MCYPNTKKHLLTAVVLLVTAIPNLLEASHFRYGHLTWRPRPDISSSSVEFKLTDAFRRSGYSGSGTDGHPIVGDTITEGVGATRLIFGDGNSTATLRYVVTSFSREENWLIGHALDPTTNSSVILHAYPSATNSGSPWVAEINSCCRISTLRNAADASYIVFSLVETSSGNSSPVSSLTPFVNLEQNGVRTFTIPASDPDPNTRFRFRLANNSESGIPNQPGPPSAPNSLSVDSVTGVVTWNTSGVDTSSLWATQIIIEDRDATTGSLRTQVAVDFIIRIVPEKSQWITYTKSNSGLPSDSVLSIAFDSSGNKWIGTNGGGLAKFSGSTWTTFSMANGSLKDANVLGIAVDPFGNVWCTTFFGLAKYNGSSWVNYDTTNSNIPYNILHGVAVRGSDVWVATEGRGVAKFNGSTWTSYRTASGLYSDTLLSVAVDKVGNVWVGTFGSGNGAVSRFNGSTWTNYTSSNSALVGNYFHFINIDDPQGNIWVASETNGIFKFDGTAWINYERANSGITSNSAFAIAIDSRNHKWIGTYSTASDTGGVADFDGTNWINYTSFKSGLIDNNVHVIAVDRSDNKWIGTTRGLSVLLGEKLNHAPFFNYPPTPANNISMTVEVGSSVSFTVKAIDSDFLDKVILNTAGLPPGATMTPSLPLSGNPVQSDFSWTPSAGQEGSYVVSFSATDSSGLQTFSTVSITVRSQAIPRIISIKDVPNDNGKAVFILWRASANDGSGNRSVTKYSIWRRDNAWTNIHDVTARGDSLYGLVAPTLKDSGAGGVNFVVFQVVAHTADPLVMAKSPVDSGYSVNNLAVSSVPAPKILSIRDVPNDNGRQVTVRWKVDMKGIDHFGVWRLDSSWTFISTVIATPDSQYAVVVPTLRDSGVIGASYYSKFKISAHTSDPLILSYSTVDSGYSVNNLRITSVTTPQILSIKDVPNDNGKQVWVTWKVSKPPAATGIELFGVWRKDSVWSYVGESKAVNDTVYSAVAPTIYDSTKTGGMVLTTFRVTSHSSNPEVFATSLPASGYSIDNLPPLAPTAPEAKQVGNTMQWVISWKPPKNQYGDFKQYALYMGSDSNFVPKIDSNRVLVNDTAYTVTLDKIGSYYYKITAVDYSGNESTPLALTIHVTTPVLLNGQQFPTEFTLFNNYPNPFNPSTIIRYGLPTHSMVKIEVFNTIGQRIATLIDGEREPGYHKVEWRANVASGIYIYRIEAMGSDNPNNTFVQVKKMVLMR